MISTMNSQAKPSMRMVSDSPKVGSQAISCRATPPSATAG